MGEVVSLSYEATAGHLEEDVEVVLDQLWIPPLMLKTIPKPSIESDIPS